MEDDEQDTHQNPGILCLPHEILELIYTSNVLDCRDICRISNTCSQLREAASSNDVWRRKLMQRYPRLYRRFPRHDTSIRWRTQFQQRNECGKEVWRQTEKLSPKFYGKAEISNEGFSGFMKIVEDYEFGLAFIIDELIAIINGQDKYRDLTVKYYAKKAVRYFQPLHLKNEWRSLLALPLPEQCLEKGAVLIAQWCQPTVDIVLEDIVSELDRIAERVRHVVLEKCPHHPLGNGIQQSSNELTESLWSSSHCRNIFECTNQVLFKELGFASNDNSSDEEEQYYDERNSFIHEVLSRKRGIPITMCLLYSCVTRRLGVVCQPVNFPSHFLLRWREHPDLEPMQQYTFIDAYGGGKFLNREECKGLIGGPMMAQVYVSDGVYEPIQPVQVFERMARNLVNIGRHHSQIGSELAALRSTIELFLAIRPGDIEHWLLLARLYLYLDINLIEVGDMFQHIVEQDPVRFGIMASLSERAQQRLETLRQEGISPVPIKPTKRSGKLKVEYSVGMIMQHKRYGYKCVVFGWDETCQASQEWIIQMGVNNLPKKHRQPFYNVLAEDCSVRYAAQENLDYSVAPVECPHPEIGKYFCEFSGTHYKPNEEKQQEYPEDYAITLKVAEEKYPRNQGDG